MTIFMKFAICLALLASPALAVEPFAIQVVDDQTGRGVPLVELRTTGNIVYVTDSNGLVAFDEPGLMNSRVHFMVRSHGYEFAKDGFGFRGRALDVKPGGEATLKIKRLNIAERLYRTTGGGIYRDTLLLRREAPIREPVLNAQVIGSDSVQSVVYRNRIRWFWGDTNRPAYPLGNFHMPGATSPLPADGGLDPERGVNLEYFAGSDGFAKSTCQMTGEGPTWFDGLTVVKDSTGRERMLASYAKIKAPMTVYRRGICIWNDEKDEFEHKLDIPLDSPVYPFGHPLLHTDHGVEYVYFGDPFPLVRVRSTVESYLDLSQYEAYTCLTSGSKLTEPKLDRDATGKLIYGWKRNAPAVGPDEQGKLIATGKIKADEALLQLRDRATGKPIVAHRGSVRWNDYRQKWIAIFCQFGGTSLLGEIWYAEASSLLGPWRDAVKVVTHDRYSFYNPTQQVMFDKEGGREIFFEGTYTASFSGNDQPTPRYDYNQIMYRLDLADERLHFRDGEKEGQ